MPDTRFHSARNECARRDKMNKHHIPLRTAQNIAITTLESRASHHRAARYIHLPHQGFGPRHTVRIGQRHTCSHFGYVSFRVKIICVYSC